MEVAGLVVGVAALVDSCIKLLEQYGQYKEYEGNVYIAQEKGKAFHVQLKKWEHDVGLVNNEKIEPHSAFLDCPADLYRITKILEMIKSSLEETVRIVSRPVESSFQRFTARCKWVAKEQAVTGRHLDIVETFINVLESAYPAKRMSEVSHKLDELVAQKHSEIRHRNMHRVCEWLNPRNFVQDLSDFAKERTEGTCEWLSEHESYKAWISCSPPSHTVTKALWISGPPGYGKSVLVSKVLEDFDKGRDHPIAYCFSRSHIDAGGKLRDVAKLWLIQLLERQPRAIDTAADTRERSQNHQATSKEVWQLLRVVCSDLAPCLVAIDGLDEYGFKNEDVAEFISVVFDTLTGVDVKILMSSRPEGDICTKFAEIESQPHQIGMYRCDLTRELTQADIKKCVGEVISKQLAKKSAKLQEKVMTEMVERSDGMFLWVRLQRSYLKPSKTERELMSILRSMPKGLDDAYEDYWKRILQNEGEKAKALAMLAWISYAVRSLTVGELAEALCISLAVTDMDCETDDDLICPDSLPGEIDESYVDNEIRGLCGAAIELRPGKKEGIVNQTVHFVHASASRFVVKKLSTLKSEKNCSDDTVLYDHALLAKCCLEYMQQPSAWARKSEYWDPDSWASRPAFLEYATQSWHLHVCAAREDNEIIQLASDFMQADALEFQQWVDYDCATQAKKYPKNLRGMVSKGTPLYYACRLSLPAVARLIHEACPDKLDVVAGEFGTALQAACATGNLETVQMLCDMGAALDTVGGAFGTAMNAAVSQGHVDCVKCLVKCAQSRIEEIQETPKKDGILDRIVNAGASAYFIRTAAIRSFEEQGMRVSTPLHCAAWHGQVSCARLLVELGAKVDARDSVDATPLILAAEKGYLELLTLLIEAGADVNARTKDGKAINDELTALSVASRYGKSSVVKKLLEAGADVTKKNSNNWLPLDYAAFRNQVEVLKLLIEHNASINSGEDGSCQALWHTSYSGSIEAAEVLINHGARSANHENSAIHNFARYGYVKMVDLLLQNGFDASSEPSKPGQYLIHAAVDGKKLDTIKLLKEHGAFLDAKTSNGETALYLAVKKDLYDIASYLLESGANPDACNNSGCTPLHAAFSVGNVRTLRLLVDHKADTETRTNSGWCLPSSLKADIDTIEHNHTFFDTDTTTDSSVTTTPANATPLMIEVIAQRLKNYSLQHQNKVLQWLRDSDADFQAIDAYGIAIYQKFPTIDERVSDLLVKKCIQMDSNCLNQNSSRLMAEVDSNEWPELTKVEHIFKRLIETSQTLGSVPNKNSPTFIEPRSFLPGTWKGVYSAPSAGSSDVDFVVESLSQHEASLSLPGAPYISASARDNIGGQFKLYGSVMPGEGCFWWNKIHSDGTTFVWNGTLTDTLADATGNAETSADNTAEEHASKQERKIVIEGNWGLIWGTWLGTFKLERTFNGQK